MSDATSVTLAGKRWLLTYHAPVVLYRLQGLPSGCPPFSDFSDPAKSLRATAHYLWAMLPKEARALYADPEAVVAVMDMDAIAPAAAAVFAAIGEAAEDAEGMGKDGGPSAKKRTPASSRSRA